MTGKKNGKTPPRGDNGKFISETMQMLEKLNTAKRTVAEKQLANANALSAAERQWAAALDRMIVTYLPDLGSRTLAVLGRDLPFFYTAGRKRTVANAQNVRVPFWTWVFGGSDDFKRSEISSVLKTFKTDLRVWLKSSAPSNVLSRYGVSDVAQRISELTNEKAALDKQYREYYGQIERLDEVRKRYAGPDAPPPPKNLSDAVAKSSAEMRANPSIVATTVTRDDTFWRDMWIISELNADHHYRHDDDYRRTGTVNYDYDRPSSPWGSPQDSGRTSEGRSSARMDDAAPAPEGRSSSRMSDAAPAEERWNSARMSDTPIIADPFTERGGHSSSRMSESTRDDSPAPSSRGTSY